ncbi:MAG: tetratricopeptide repeat protein, partial [Candidatus Omnitrophica bacterium]|nr:tetratricopeptide repeat protein [Candidatus Omnitrophota bacterium]
MAGPLARSKIRGAGVLVRVANRMKEHYALGMRYHQEKKYALALEEFSCALAQSPQNHAIQLEIGNVYCSMGEVDEAIKIFRPLKSLGFRSQELSAALVNLYRQKDDFHSAAQELRDALLHNPQDPELHFQLAEVYHYMREYPLAIEEIEKTLVLGGDSREARAELGRIYKETGQFQRAISEYKRLLVLEPVNPEFFLELEWLYRTMEEYDSALEQLEQARAAGMDRDDLYLRFGCLYLKKNEYDLALSAFNRCLALQPSSYMARIKRSIIYREKRNLQAALDELQIVLGQGIDNADIRLALGEIYYQQQEYSKAKESFLAAKEFSPHDSSCYCGMALIYEKEGKYLVAIRELEEAVVHAGSSERLRDGLRRLSHKQRVCEQFQQNVEDTATDGLLNIGFFTEYIFQEGFTVFERKLQILCEKDPLQKRAQIELAWISLWINDRHKAEEKMRELCAFIPSEKNTLFTTLKKKVEGGDY